jgi:hypothetical protein
MSECTFSADFADRHLKPPDAHGEAAQIAGDFDALALMKNPSKCWTHGFTNDLAHAASVLQQDPLFRQEVIAELQKMGGSYANQFSDAKLENGHIVFERR